MPSASLDSLYRLLEQYRWEIEELKAENQRLNYLLDGMEEDLAEAELMEMGLGVEQPPGTVWVVQSLAEH